MSRARRADRDVEFKMSHGTLVRTVQLPDRRSYQHRCTFESFAEVARYIEGHANAGVTTNLLWERLDDVPCTQATVALEFLKDRGLVDVERRRCFPNSNAFFEHALCEWHALDHQSQFEDEDQ